ncbi:hypothetical protein HDU93_004326 [Gonapodya sp. JEL0774]|nr:hypothetical protein HDU93_004326 [Gonapodya sp. JEL0774]
MEDPLCWSKPPPIERMLPIADVTQPLEIQKRADHRQSSHDSGMATPIVGSPDTAVAVAEYLAAHELEGGDGLAETIRGTLSRGSSDGSERVLSPRRYRPNVDRLKAELEKLHLRAGETSGGARGSGAVSDTQSLPEGTARPGVARHTSVFSDTGKYHETSSWAERSNGWRSACDPSSEPSSGFSPRRVTLPRPSYSHASEAAFSLPFLVEDLELDFGVDVPETPQVTVVAGSFLRNQPALVSPQPNISYDELATFRPYNPSNVRDSDRLSILSYPSSSIIRPSSPQPAPRPATRPTLPVSASVMDTLRVTDRELGELEFRLEWKSATESTYKELMGILGTDECRIQRGWEYKKKDVDSLQWSVTYAPGKHENLRHDPSGMLPRMEMTIFYNSIQLFLLAGRSLPRKLSNLRVPNFIAEFVEPLATPTEWAEIEAQGSTANNTYHVGLVVRAQGDPLNDRCKKILEAWTKYEFVKVKSAQVGILGRATSVARIMAQKAQGHSGGSDRLDSKKR